MSQATATRQADTQFKQEHDKAALHQAFTIHKSQGRSNTEFAELNGLHLRTLQGYIAEWKREEAGIPEPQDQATGGEQEFSQPESLDRKLALKVRRLAMRGEPVTPTRLKAAQDVLNESDTVDDERSEFQAWTDSALRKLVVELAPKCVLGEVEVKRDVPAPLDIEGTPAADALTPTHAEPAFSLDAQEKSDGMLR